MTKSKIFITLLMFCLGAFFLTIPAYASESVAALAVEEVWLEGDTLHIQVKGNGTDANQALEVNLRDYAGTGDEYVSVQAIDRAGNQSNVIQFKNPYYIAPAPEGAFTPDGAGTVLDNALNVNGEDKEFFTIEAEDGAVFYLIIDRQRTVDNVYFLNAVTQRDLLSLAAPGDGTSESVIPGNAAEQPSPAPPPADPSQPEPELPAKPPALGGSVIFIILAALAAGATGYYFKILRPKQQTAAEGNEEYEELGDDAGDEDEENYSGEGDESEEDENE